MGGVVTMSIVSFGRGYLSTTPFDKTAWLNRVCRERADGSKFVCLSHRAESSEDVGEKCKTWVVEAKTGKAAPQIHSTCALAPKVDSRSSRVALGLKALLKPPSSTRCTNAPLKCLFCSPDKWVWKYYSTPCPTT